MRKATEASDNIAMFTRIIQCPANVAAIDLPGIRKQALVGANAGILDREVLTVLVGHVGEDTLQLVQLAIRSRGRPRAIES